MEFLLRCRNRDVITNFFVSSHSHKASLTYKQCQLKLLQEEICHKRSSVKFLKKEFNSIPSLLQHETSFIDLAQISSLFLKSNNKMLTSKSAAQQKGKLIEFKISMQDPNKIMFKFSKYELSDCLKRLLAKCLNFRLSPKHLDYVDYLLNFDLFCGILSNEDLDFVENKKKRNIPLLIYGNIFLKNSFLLYKVYVKIEISLSKNLIKIILS